MSWNDSRPSAALNNDTDLPFLEKSERNYVIAELPPCMAHELYVDQIAQLQDSAAQPKDFSSLEDLTRHFLAHLIQIFRLQIREEAASLDEFLHLFR